MWQSSSQPQQEQFKKMRDYITRLLKENKDLQSQTTPKAPIPPHSVRSYSSTQLNKAEELLQRSSRPAASDRYQNFSTSGYLDVSSPSSKEREAFFTRLYEEGAKKQEIIDRYREERKNKELQGCTFKPSISTSVCMTSPVFERLSKSNKHERAELYQKQKEEKEMKDCTFKPETNPTKKLSRNSSFDALYKDAENFRKKLRGREIEKKETEMQECTFQPKVKTSRKRSESPSVYQKLYETFQKKQRDLRKKELQQRLQEKEENTFTPQLLTPKKPPSDVPAYERLYQIQKEKMEKQRKEQERKRSSSAPRERKETENPRYNSLYELHKVSLQKKEQMKDDFLKEAGASFKPDTSKSLKSLQSLKSSPNVRRGSPRVSILHEAR